MKLLNCLAAALFATSATAATPSAPAPSTPPGADAESKHAAALKSLAWLEGCWLGTAGPFEFREQWMPLRGQMMMGVSQTVDGKGATQSYEYIRLEPRAGGVFYVATQPGKAEVALKFDGETTDKSNGRDDTIFTFVNQEQEFPKVIVYRRASEGWLYASVEGKVGGAERKSNYPMRRINCETGESIGR